jgi:hypothetical protein
VDAASGTADGATITLTNVDPDVIAFADRPARLAQRYTTDDFFAARDDLGFGSDAPNAALSAVVGGTEQTSTITLHDPQWDREAATLVVTYDVLPAGDDERVGDVVGSRAEPAAQFEQASLFIDAGGTAGVQTGEATLSAITEAEFEELSSQAGRNGCVSPRGSIEVCSLITIDGSFAQWTVVAQAPEGISVASSTAELTWIIGPTGEGITSPARPSSRPTPGGYASFGMLPGCSRRAASAASRSQSSRSARTSSPRPPAKSRHHPNRTTPARRSAGLAKPTATRETARLVRAGPFGSPGAGRGDPVTPCGSGGSQAALRAVAGLGSAVRPDRSDASVCSHRSWRAIQARAWSGAPPWELRSLRSAFLVSLMASTYGSYLRYEHPLVFTDTESIYSQCRHCQVS